MFDENAPEPGTKAKVETDAGTETAVYTGHTWASEDGSRIIETVKSWEEQPSEEELKVTGLPDKLEEPPTGDEEPSAGEEQE